MTDPDVLDPAVVDSLRQLTPPGEPDVLGEVLRLFLDEVPRRIARLEAAWHDHNAGELQRAAHSLKGSSGNIGAHHMHDDLQAARRTRQGRRLQRRASSAGFARRGIQRVEAEIRRLLG